MITKYKSAFQKHWSNVISQQVVIGEVFVEKVATRIGKPGLRKSLETVSSMN